MCIIIKLNMTTKKEVIIMEDRLIEYKFLHEYKMPLTGETFLTKYINSFYTSSLKMYKDVLEKSSIYIMLKQTQGFEKFMYYKYPKITDLNDIEEIHLLEFRNFCFYGLFNHRNTVNNKLTSLRHFFDYLADKNLVDYNLALSVKKLKTENCKLPTVFTYDQLKILFASLYAKNRLIALIISRIVLTTGAKIQDILAITIGDLNMTDKIISINSSLYPIGNELYNDLRKYLLIRREYNIYGRGTLFIAKKGKEYSIRVYQMHFREAIKGTSIPQNLSPRYLRTTFLYNMAKVVEENKLKEISNQNKLDHYYKLLKNPLQKLT